MPHWLFCWGAERKRVLQLLKIPYATLPDLLLHLKILPKIHHLHNLWSIILVHTVILQSLLLTLPLLKIHQLNKLLSNVLLHMFIF
jgi:hypothetical protein